MRPWCHPPLGDFRYTWCVQSLWRELVKILNSKAPLAQGFWNLPSTRGCAFYFFRFSSKA